ncbi:hypothetical protein M8G38_13020 [Providencia stuartii]|uniref:hypothetical protein n=1 Tax=Providencia stuartii TaxID=588 RepID=UPI00201D531F|nr:hypothetical protein [Providencia stuartii]UQZ10719.1 hypothetical protein M8G38_13020 [Providencia stuartii]
MKFEDLPEDIRMIAAGTLSELLKQGYVNKELAEDTANSVKAAFIQLYKEDIAVNIAVIDITTS